MADYRPYRVGILDFSDGRDFLQKPLEGVCREFRDSLRHKLESAGFEVHTGSEVIWQNDVAVREAKSLAAKDVDAVVFNYSVWAWPQYSRVAAQFLPQPIVMFSNVNPRYPGLVGMLAASGSLDQVGIKFSKTFGDISDSATFETLASQIRGIGAARRLRGETYCLFGGRSLGIDTTVIDPALWMKQFGIDVDHVDQFEVTRRAEIEIAKNERVKQAFEYLKKHVRKIHWTKPDAKFVLTEELLQKQLGMYYAMWDICSEFKYDFCGIKGQREMTEHYATCDVAEAFLNDPYHPTGEAKRPIVCSTEADGDAALTMEILSNIKHTPALFADVRHYHSELGVWDLCNSGEHATYFATGTFDPIANLAKTEFRPEGFYFPAGGASVYHIAAPGKVTLARCTRHDGEYVMTALHGEFMDYGEKENERVAAITQDNWPHAFAKFDCSPETFVSNFNANHIHAVYGDVIPELQQFCGAVDMKFKVLS
ncbi:MAG: fucose isomerase [Planctomycetes bacterium]|nr:fucose isomerase [Planctomycetota bacterium]